MAANVIQKGLSIVDFLILAEIGDSFQSLFDCFLWFEGKSAFSLKTATILFQKHRMDEACSLAQLQMKVSSL